MLPAVLTAQARPEARDRGPGVVGVVVDRETRRPLEGVAVTLTPMPDSAGVLPPGPTPSPVLTDAEGRFLFGGLPDGLYGIVVERIGYQGIVDSLAYEAALGLRIDAELAQDAVELEPLLVVAEARSRNLENAGFYERQRRGIGRFVTREQIETRMHLQVSDILRSMAGVRVSPPGRFRTQGVVLLRGGCVADVYVDGVRTVPPYPVDVMLRPMDLDAVEVYHGSELPARFGTTSCGAVMLWTHVPNPGTRGNPFTWGRVLAALGFVAAALLLTR